MLVYRIVHRNYCNSLFASGLEGRWNSKGKKVVYTAESIPLAFLENMIRRQGVGFNNDFKIMIIEIPENTIISDVKISDLEDGWRSFRNYSTCQFIGDQWYDDNKTLILRVPSAVLPEAFNYIVHSEHRDYKRVRLIKTTDLIPDNRIEEILKKYSR